ncbi:hypothetical protein ACFPRL_22970 [Pseudoclavibacter helvolus]
MTELPRRIRAHHRKRGKRRLGRAGSRRSQRRQSGAGTRQSVPAARPARSIQGQQCAGIRRAQQRYRQEECRTPNARA